jgi:hypothetical protein
MFRKLLSWTPSAKASAATSSAAKMELMPRPWQQLQQLQQLQHTKSPLSPLGNRNIYIYIHYIHSETWLKCGRASLAFFEIALASLAT